MMVHILLHVGFYSLTYLCIAPPLTEVASGLVESDMPQTQVKGLNYLYSCNHRTHILLLVVLRRFDLSVTVEWLERAKGLRPSAKGKKAEETKPTHQPHVIADMSRVSFITAALAAHGYQNIYTPGVVNGPAFKIYCAGSM
jgi:hypothetical protein